MGLFSFIKKAIDSVCDEVIHESDIGDDGDNTPYWRTRESGVIRKNPNYRWEKDDDNTIDAEATIR